MPEGERTFPDPGFRPGDYSVDWLVGRSRRFSGEVELAPRRLPRIEPYGKLRSPRRNAAGELVYPLPGREIRYPRVVGRLRSNEEVVLIDAALSDWFPERFVGRARWAIVGLGVSAIPDDRYGHVSFQITDADLWAGIPPLAQTTWPKPGSASQDFSATLNPDAHRVWRDTRNGVTVDFGYSHSFSLDPYKFGLTFAPIFDVYSRQNFTLDEWRDQWVAPLIDLASFATKRPQTLSWLTVHHGSGRSRISGTVFTGGIHQAPYTAHYDIEWRTDAERKPLFTLPQLSMTPMKLIRRWRELHASDDPFIELYRATLFQTDLPPRARYLQLIQALEARHSYANRNADEKAQAKFGVQRQQTIDAAQRAGLAGRDLRFLKDEWSKRRRDSLERRLLPLLRDLPVSVRQALESDQALDPIRSQLIADEDAKTFQAQLRVLRNQLSHGERNYHDGDLKPWVDALETICRGQLLGLLGFAASDVESTLATIQ
jgi:hypothetical protein